MDAPDPAPALPAPPAWLVEDAFTLQPPRADERRHVLRDEAGLLLDRLLVRVARGHGAIDVALGEGLAALGAGDRALRLGYSSVGDYALAKLDVAPRTAQASARLARELRSRPLLREAVRRGEVSARKAQAVLPLAVGDAEAEWVARAKEETVRALEAAARACRPALDRGGLGRRDGEGRTRGRDASVALARRARRGRGPRRGRGGRGSPPRLRRGALRRRAPARPRPPPPRGDARPVGRAPRPPRDAPPVDRALEGHGVRLLRPLLRGAARDGGADRRQRAALERRLYALPALRAALRAGRLSYEKARLVAKVADETSLEGWIAQAEFMTCVALRRAVEAREEAQLRAARSLDLRVPRSVGVLAAAAFQAVREAEGRWLSPGECLVRVAQHFLETWKDAVPRRRTRSQKVRDRDLGCCQVPGCTRAAAHAHHVDFLSRGGSDDLWNQVGLCAAHHLHGVHAGYVRVSGRAPDALTWELGRGWDGKPLEVFEVSLAH